MYSVTQSRIAGTEIYMIDGRANICGFIANADPACLALAREAGIEKAELEVYSDKVAAVRLYRSFGFSEEGLKVRGRKLEGRYQDILLMALWL